ncbi:helix-turn-helix domain-containing protein [Streptomyces sp. NPDC058286]|uniref:helix-turn-helix domain-containing protein n=1 Tax=Streptomyces sp. NPDC058286 TaxID=3346422 RepID=UPI0036E9FD83
MTPGEQVRAWRRRRGLTQAELAAAAGTQQASVSRIEKGTDVPTLPLLERIAEAMCCNVTITLTDRDEHPGRVEGIPGELLLSDRDIRYRLKSNGS